MSLHRSTLKTQAVPAHAALRLERVRREGADFLVEAGLRGVLLRPPAPGWFDLAHSPEAMRIKRGARRSVWRVSLGDQPFIAKSYSAGDAWSRLRQFFTGSPAEREWRTMRVAAARGVAVAEAAAVGVEAGGRRRSVLIVHVLQDAQDLVTRWQGIVSVDDPRSRRSAGMAIIDAVARLFADAHTRGVIHRDPHPENVMIEAADGDAGSPRAVFLDVYGADVVPGPASSRTLARMLARLDQRGHRMASRTERLRFVKAILAYSASQTGEGAASLPALLADVRRESLRHRNRLAAQRDRRNRGQGKYFGKLAVGGGWEALVVLRLERRHVFPEAQTPDRTIDEWRSLLQASLPDAESRVDRMETAGVGFEARRANGLLERLAWTLGGSPHQRTFLTCHRMRHRDEPHPLILGFARRRRLGLIDRTVLITPADAGVPGSPTEE